MIVEVIGGIGEENEFGKQYRQGNRVYNPNGLSPALSAQPMGNTAGYSPMIVEKTIVAMQRKAIKIRQATKEGFIDLELPGLADLEYPSSQTRRGRVIEGGQICPTLTTENIPSLVELGDESFWNFLYDIDGEIQLIRIRKLIPLECGRLMGVSDEDCEKILAVESNSQAYKAFGNSIVVDVLKAIFSQMNIKGVAPWNERVND